MGSCGCYPCCTIHFCVDWIMRKRHNFIIVTITLVLYAVNQLIKTKISIKFLRWFMSCYFNDFIGSITFIAYCNVILSFCNKEMTKLWQILLIIFSAGLFWEYVTPLFRKNTVSDIGDIVAYMIGGIVYWLINKILIKRNFM